MELLKDSKKLYIVMIIPTLIIAAILFYLEFLINDIAPSIITFVGFGVLIGSGSFIYFSNVKKAREEKDFKEASKGYLLYMVPTIIISALLFLFIDRPHPPYLLVYGLAIFLIAFTGVYFLAIKAEIA